MSDYLRNLKVGDTVTRMLAGTVPVTLQVTEVTDKLIRCGMWDFDRATGVEVDDFLGWGPDYGVTGSYLKPPETNT